MVVSDSSCMKQCLQGHFGDQIDHRPRALGSVLTRTFSQCVGPKVAPAASCFIPVPCFFRPITYESNF